MISFEPRVGKAQTGQTSGGFTVIIPITRVIKDQTSALQNEEELVQNEEEK